MGWFIFILGLLIASGYAWGLAAPLMIGFVLLILWADSDETNQEKGEDAHIKIERKK